jgi:hypothetical protein
MVRIPTPLLALLILLCATAGASANGFDPNKIPKIGTIAPAFGLQPFESSPAKSEETDVLQLDSICGLRPGDTRGLLIVFIEAKQVESLELINNLHRKFSRQGLEVLAISVDPKPIEFASKLERTHVRFPVLNDKHRIVAERYGASDTPFSMLLNRECRVLGFSSKTFAEEEEALTGSIEALMNEQIGTVSGSMD